LGSDPKSATSGGDHDHVDGLSLRLCDPPGKCLDQRELLLAPVLHVPSLIAETEAMRWTASGNLRLFLDKSLGLVHDLSRLKAAQHIHRIDADVVNGVAAFHDKQARQTQTANGLAHAQVVLLAQLES